VAKLMDWGGGDSEPTRSIQRLFTLRYASPEQARGMAAGVPSDIYSLGLLFFELVTGRRAQAVENLPMDEALHFITSRELARPAGMDRDLFAIAAKAAAKEPGQRYRSAAEMGEDLHRYLRGYAVLAHPPSIGYRLGKLARRNKSAAAVVAVAALAVLAALAAFIVQFRVAQRERSLAEKRFEAARQMAQLMVFDAPQKLAGVPATLEVRQWTAERAADYLAQLARGVEGDVPLALSVARSYRQVAFQYFNTNSENLNDPAKALDALERGAAVLERLRHKSAEVWVELAENRLARPYVRLRKLDPAVANEKAAFEITERLRAERHPLAEELHARVLYLQATNDRHSPAELIRIWGEVERFYQEQLRQAPTDGERMRQLALIHKNVSGVYAARSDWPEALRHDRLAVEQDERRLKLKPDDPVGRMDLSFSYGRLGQDLFLSGQRVEGIAYIRKALAIRRALAERDPQDRRARDRLAWMLGLLSDHLLAAGEIPEAQQAAREALLLLDAIKTPGVGDYSIAGLHRLLALGFEKNARRDEACLEWQAAQAALPAGYVPMPGALLREEDVRKYAAACAARSSSAR